MRALYCLRSSTAYQAMKLPSRRASFLVVVPADDFQKLTGEVSTIEEVEMSDGDDDEMADDTAGRAESGGAAASADGGGVNASVGGGDRGKGSEGGGTMGSGFGFGFGGNLSLRSARAGLAR